MTSDPLVVVHRDAAVLAKAVAARFITRLVDAQAAQGSAAVVLTGGGIGGEVLREVRDSPARDAIDWRRLDVWWGDERFLPSGDPERNETQSRALLLDHVPVDPSRVHPMPASDGPDGADPEAAAERYAAELAAAARPEDHAEVPSFDVLLLGVGEEGHTASIFPSAPAAYDDRSVVAVRGSPKPPPTRLSLTFQSIGCAREVWLLVSGAAKAPAVELALSGAGRIQVPAAGARGRARTVWLLDHPAASKLPPELRNPW